MYVLLYYLQEQSHLENLSPCEKLCHSEECMGYIMNVGILKQQISLST